MVEETEEITERDHQRGRIDIGMEADTSEIPQVLIKEKMYVMCFIVDQPEGRYTPRRQTQVFV